MLPLCNTPYRHCTALTIKRRDQVVYGATVVLGRHQGPPSKLRRQQLSCLGRRDFIPHLHRLQTTQKCLAVLQACAYNYRHDMYTGTGCRSIHWRTSATHRGMRMNADPPVGVSHGIGCHPRTTPIGSWSKASPNEASDNPDRWQITQNPDLELRQTNLPGT